MQKIELQPAFVLHTRPYRDTSLIVEFFTLEYGRVAAVARGVRKTKNPKRSILNPFIPLLISVQGKGNLKLLTHVETYGLNCQLEKKHLYSGLYLNELLIRLLPEWDAHENIYLLYINALLGLGGGMAIEPILRRFETALLTELGYGIDWSIDALTNREIDPEHHYALDVEKGFVLVNEHNNNEYSFLGEDIISAGTSNYKLKSTLRAAKLINRLLLKPLLGSKPLQARALFVGV